MQMDIKDYTIPQEMDRYLRDLKKFTMEELEPLAAKIDRENNHDIDEIRPKIQPLGLFTLPCPKEYGGMGLTPSQWTRLENLLKPAAS